jgi:hypothetical protein
MSNTNNTTPPPTRPLQEDIEAYLQHHPEVKEYMAKMEKAQAIFGGYLRFAQGRVVLRDLGGASTSEAKLNATVSPVNR